VCLLSFRYFRTAGAKRVSQFILGILTKIPLFKDLNSFQLSLIAAVAKIEMFNKDEIIIKKNDIGDTFYIVLEGQVHCSDAMLLPIHRTSDPRLKGSFRNKSPDTTTAAIITTAASVKMDHDNNNNNNNSRGDDVAQKEGYTVTGESDDASKVKSSTDDPKATAEEEEVVGVKLQAGEWFGEIALLTGCVRTANVIADTPVRLATFDRHAFEKVLGNLKDIIDKEFNNRMLSNLELIASLPPERVSMSPSHLYICLFSSFHTLHCVDFVLYFMFLYRSSYTHGNHA
jgi:CRP-like cAMP-binding protein